VRKLVAQAGKAGTGILLLTPFEQHFIRQLKGIDCPLDSATSAKSNANAKAKDTNVCITNKTTGSSSTTETIQSASTSLAMLMAARQEESDRDFKQMQALLLADAALARRDGGRGECVLGANKACVGFVGSMHTCDAPSPRLWRGGATAFWLSRRFFHLIFISRPL
jgi:hypothetical protein